MVPSGSFHAYLLCESIPGIFPPSSQRPQQLHYTQNTLDHDMYKNRGTPATLEKETTLIG